MTSTLFPLTPAGNREVACSWDGDPADVACHGPALLDRLANVRSPLHIVRLPSGTLGLTTRGVIRQDAAGRLPAHGTVPPLYPEWLGNRQFQEAHHTRFGYVIGEMAHAISGPRMVKAAAEAGMLAFLGTAGVVPDRVERMIRDLGDALDPAGRSWGVNLISMPDARDFESAMVTRYLQHGVRRMCASAFRELTSDIVRYACTGLAVTPAGVIRRRHHLFAKVSRIEVARPFMTPPPAAMLDALVRAGALTAAEADLGARLPVAEDVTLEADSAGHTDNRPLAVLLPRVAMLRDELTHRYRFPRPIRLGAAGGLGTPNAVAAAFSLGADYVLTGSVNQVAVEASVSDEAKAMLAAADVTDTAMAPSGDMFELGVRVQVLQRGTLYPARARLLRELYATYDTLDDLPPRRREQIEREIFRAPLEEIWSRTEDFFREQRPAELLRARNDPRHRMALVFRWYLGSSARWPIDGPMDRRADFQLWCGPALGGFNAWAAGSFLEDPRERTVEQIGKNLLEGAAVIVRAQQFRAMGVGVPAAAFAVRPRRLT